MTKESPQMKPKGVDEGWSWVIAVLCFLLSLVLAGIFRTSGVLFVAFIQDYGVTREEASWPIVVCIAVLNLTGPFSGTLGQRFGTRPVVIGGALIATIGIASCFLTTSLKVITILFGGVFGIGYGLMSTLMPVILNAYFLDLRATANGIANSGSCVGSMILPIIFEYLISSYGLSGCFLLTGGIVLHLTVAGALMRPPPWLEWKKYHEAENMRKNLQAIEKTEKHTITGSSSIHDRTSPVADSRDETIHNHLHSVETASLLQQQDRSSNPGTNTAHSNPQLLLQNEKISKSDKQDLSNKEANNPCEAANEFLKSSIISSFIRVLKCPMFYITASTYVCFYFLYHMYVVIIVDYALDRGVKDVNTKYVLMAFSISDMFGRLCLGWVTDRKYITRSRFVMLCMTLIGVTFFMFPYANGYTSLIVVSCTYGLLLGCTMVIFPILLVDFCGLELHAVAFGCMCFLNGFSSFGRPFLIGYFRDSIGSYSNMFYLLGGISVAASTFWLLESCFVSKQRPHLQQHVL